MSKSIVLVIIAAILLGLIPIIPRMVALRVRVLRFLHWNWFADWHERNAHGITVGVRIFLAVLAVYLLTLGLF